MIFKNNKVSDIKIAYIGGGSRGWAWGLMSDLVIAKDISGDVYLYDIDSKAAFCNEIIGNKMNKIPQAKTHWNYHAVEKIEDALNGANFIVISILPGTFDEMESDVHCPEKYGIYQSVGDTIGPGGLVRAMRTIPMYEFIAEKIKECCPNAWVINYTNPMTLCTKTLYRVFPEIKAFGCCHEVFGTQRFLAKMVRTNLGLLKVDRHEIKVNPVGVNHFTWLTKATYNDLDLFPMYKEFVKKYKDIGFKTSDIPFDDWKHSTFRYDEMVKMDLFDRFGWIAAAGDRHLAEFCDGKWYLENPEKVKKFHFGLTTVEWRKNELKERLQKSSDLVSGKKRCKLKITGEEGVNQIRALLGLHELVTNVNIPNVGQIPNLPLGAIVETNAVFRANSLTPVMAGNVPDEIYPLISKIVNEQEKISKGCETRDLEMLFDAFKNDNLVTCSEEDARKLFKEMMNNTSKYLEMYDIEHFE